MNTREASRPGEYAERPLDPGTPAEVFDGQTCREPHEVDKPWSDEELHAAFRSWARDTEGLSRFLHACRE